MDVCRVRAPPSPVASTPRAHLVAAQNIACCCVGTIAVVAAVAYTRARAAPVGVRQFAATPPATPVRAVWLAKGCEALVGGAAHLCGDATVYDDGDVYDSVSRAMATSVWTAAYFAVGMTASAVAWASDRLRALVDAGGCATRPIAAVCAETAAAVAIALTPHDGSYSASTHVHRAATFMFVGLHVGNAAYVARNDAAVVARRVSAVKVALGVPLSAYLVFTYLHEVTGGQFFLTECALLLLYLIGNAVVVTLR